MMKLYKQKRLLEFFKNKKIFCTSKGEIISFLGKEIFVLRARPNKDGYLMVDLGTCEKRFMAYTHNVVWLFFNPELVSEKLQVHHINSNRADSNINNLQLVTQGENIKYSFISGRRTQRGAHNNSSKLTEREVIAIKKSILAGARTTHLAKKYRVSVPLISNIRAGRVWGHL